MNAARAFPPAQKFGWRPSEATEADKGSTYVLQLLVGFLPWIILAVLGEQALVLALLLALAVAAVTTFRQFMGGRLKILDSVTFAFFAFMALVIVGFHWMAIVSYLSLLVNVTLMAIAWGSLLVGTPFTIQYAREQVAPERWHSPAFVRVNQYITAVWGLYFSLCALIALYRLLSGNPDLAWKYAWVALGVLAALFSSYFPAWYRAHVLRAGPQQ
jgi:hypothetical protein